MQIHRTFPFPLGRVPVATCGRCRATEPISARQVVKFDLQERSLCRRCWDELRRWLQQSERLRGGSMESAA